MPGANSTDEANAEEEANAEQMTTPLKRHKLNRTREDRWNELACQLDPAWRRRHGPVQAVLYRRAGLAGPKRLPDLGVLRPARRFAGRLLRPRRARRHGGREPAGQRLQRRR